MGWKTAPHKTKREKEESLGCYSLFEESLEEEEEAFILTQNSSSHFREWSSKGSASENSRDAADRAL